MKRNTQQIAVVTLFPEIFEALHCGITGRAQQQGLLELSLWNPRDYSQEKHRQVDDKPYGGGAGMVMMVQPLRDTITAAKQQLGDDTQVIYLSPQGQQLTQQHLQQVACTTPLLLIAGRYEGIDERILDTMIDAVWSIGDYILSGGELAAMVIIDSLTRLIPGSIGHPDVHVEESFNHNLLEYPQYTRPENIDGETVPPILLSGDHQAISRWRLKQSLGRTWLKRPDLLINKTLTNTEQQLLDEFKQEKQAS